MTEKIINGCILFVSIFYLYFARQLAFGTISSPQSGFMPVLAGIIGVLLSIILLISNFKKKDQIKNEPVDWTKFIFVVIGLFFYIILLNILGYWLATFILLCYLFKVADIQGWAVPFFIAGISTTAFYLLFKYFLNITLP